MAENDRTLEFVNAVVGIAGGVAGFVIAISSSLPQSSLIPIGIAAGCLIVTPFIRTHALKKIQPDDPPLPFLQYYCYALWGFTALFLAGLIASHLVWATIPDRIHNTAVHPPYSDYLIAQFDSSTSNTSPPGIMNDPNLAFSEWQRAEDSTASSIGVLGIAEKQTDAQGNNVYILRLYPASSFFSVHRGPVSVFESLLKGWLVIYATAVAFVLFVIPWLNNHLRQFRKNSSNVDVKPDLSSTGDTG